MGGLFGVYCVPTESQSLTRKGTPESRNGLELEILLTENPPLLISHWHCSVYVPSGLLIRNLRVWEPPVESEQVIIPTFNALSLALLFLTPWLSIQISYTMGG